MTSTLEAPLYSESGLSGSQPPESQVSGAEAPKSEASVARRPWRLLMGSSARTYSSDMFDVGSSIRVRTRYLGSWTQGFEVAKVLEDGYLIRRVSDGALLPEVVGFEDVRAAGS
jgi:hypothetical protein